MDYSCPKCNANLRFQLLPRVDTRNNELKSSITYQNQQTCPFCHCYLLFNESVIESVFSKLFGFFVLLVLLIDAMKFLERPILMVLLLCGLGLHFYIMESKLKEWPRYVEGIIASQEILRKQKILLSISVITILAII